MTGNAAIDDLLSSAIDKILHCPYGRKHSPH
jgi:hypothetical protein